MVSGRHELTDEWRQIRNRDQLPGLWPGVVEYNQDPLQIGRVKVRVPPIHGFMDLDRPKGVDEETVPEIRSEDLPWAWVLRQGGGAHDTGEYEMPAVGSAVWVAFIGGDPQQPMVMGTVNGIPFDEQVFGAADESESVPDSDELSMGKWTRPARPSSARESQMMHNHDPTRRVNFKTPKGHSLHTDDLDEREHLQLVDRAGQGLRMEAPVLEEENEGNKEQRGLRTSFDGTQLEYGAKMAHQEARMMLQDLANQGIHFQTRKGDERVKIISNGISGRRDIDLGDDQQSLEFHAGHSRTVLLGMSNGKPAVRIKWDSDLGQLEIHTEEEVVVKTKQAVLDVDQLSIKGDVLVHGNITTTGHVVASQEVISGKTSEERSDAYR